MADPRLAGDNVVTVQFGPSDPTDVSRPRERPGDPVTSVYSVHDAARIFGLEPARLRSWERAGLVRPSGELDGRPGYTFQDLVGVRTARDLVARGVSVARIRRAVEAIRRALPGTTPLSELRIVCDGKTLAVRKGGSTFDPLTGQLLLDFDLGTLRDDVVRALPQRDSASGSRSAYDYFLEGCRLDDDETTSDRAERAYRRAIRLDPTLATAYVNLGTLRLCSGDVVEAEALYRRALSIDSNLAEAYYNLGFVRLEVGALTEAIELLGRAVELEPDFADAHFNLASALTDTGRRNAARVHWTAYLDLEPDGRFASIARARLRRA